MAAISSLTADPQAVRAIMAIIHCRSNSSLSFRYVCGMVLGMKRDMDLISPAQSSPLIVLALSPDCSVMPFPSHKIAEP
jgi:hypothetical protein